MSKRFLWNLQQMRKVIRPFWWHQNLVPWGLSAPALGLHVFNHEKKNCIKSDFKDVFFKLATNEWNDKTLSVDIKTLSPEGCLPPANEHLLYKVRLQGDFLKLATYDWSDKRFLLISKFCPQGVVSPFPGDIFMYKIMKKKCIKSYKEFFFCFVF